MVNNRFRRLFQSDKYYFLNNIDADVLYYISSNYCFINNTTNKKSWLTMLCELFYKDEIVMKEQFYNLRVIKRYLPNIKGPREILFRHTNLVKGKDYHIIYYKGKTDLYLKYNILLTLMSKKDIHYYSKKRTLRIICQTLIDINECKNRKDNNTNIDNWLYCC